MRAIPPSSPPVGARHTCPDHVGILPSLSFPHRVSVHSVSQRYVRTVLGFSGLAFQLSTFNCQPPFPLSLLECAVPKNAPISPLDCAVPKTNDLKSFRMRSSEKT